jgi:hypothetical protein
MFKQTASSTGEIVERTLRHRDTWGGKNYGCFPINTPGQQLKEKLDQSDQWKLVERNDRIDARNDNQVDIHRGSDFVYLHKDGNSRIDVVMNKSRSRKTADWTFRLNFAEPISF